MPGFFSSKTANTLTTLSDYYIDWSRVVELFASNKHHYTWDQLIQRGVILASSAYGAYAGYNRADSEFGLSSSLYSMAGCFIGFTISHLVIIAPLIYKRHQMDKVCLVSHQETLNSIKMLSELAPGNKKITQLIVYIINLVDSTNNISLSNEKHANALQTWGKRKGLMEKINCRLKSDLMEAANERELDSYIDKLNAFWSQDKQVVYDILSGNKSDTPSIPSQIPEQVHPSPM